MSRARDYRRNKDGRAEDRFAERRRRFGPVLRALGLAEEFGRIRRPIQEFFWRWKFPDLELRWDGAIPAAVRRAVERAARGAGVEVECEAGGAKVRVTARDFLSVVEGMLFQAEVLAELKMGAPEGPFVARAMEVLRGVWDRHHREAIAALFHALFVALASHSRIEGQLFSVRTLSEWGEDHKFHHVLEVYAERAERAHVRLDGGVRPAYRVGHTGGPTGLEWVSWDARGLGLGDSAEAMPVFVQSHALNQLHERLDPRVPGVAAWIEHHMARSLAEPVIAERQRGGDVLVECRVSGKRVGYFVANVADGRVVVRTFLLVTMRGTPEGERLYRRFRLTRDEAGWLGLNKLSSFTGTDIADDAELRGMLVECGCGGLLELPRVAAGPGEGGVSFAAELRKYLRMEPAREEGGRVAA
jgi:hypothetical protein